VSDFDTSWVKHIDWTKEKTYEDLGQLFGALSQAFLGAVVTSGSGDLVDGRTKQYVLARMVELAALMNKHEEWVRFRGENSSSPHAGHRKE
jgi:hypothetical protein